MNIIPYSRFQEYQDRRQMIRDRILVDISKENAARAARVDSETSPQEKKKK